MSPLFFISRSRSLSPFFSLSFAGLPPTFSFSLSFSCSIFQICGYDNTDTETISAFRFRLYWLFCSALQDAGGYAISCQNNLELYLGCHTSWLSYFTLVCLWCGWTVAQAVGRCMVMWLPNFLGWVDYFIFSPMVFRYNDENFFWSGFYCNQRRHGNVYGAMTFFIYLCVSLYQEFFYLRNCLRKGVCACHNCLNYGKVWTNSVRALLKYFEMKFWE